MTDPHDPETRRKIGFCAMFVRALTEYLARADEELFLQARDIVSRQRNETALSRRAPVVLQNTLPLLKELVGDAHWNRAGEYMISRIQKGRLQGRSFSEGRPRVVSMGSEDDYPARSLDQVPSSKDDSSD